MKRDLKLSPRQKELLNYDRYLSELARWMDSAFEIPGLRWRFGLDGLLGLIPGLGDTITALASFYILAAGARMGVPRVTMVRMALNIAADYVVGSIPVVGDLFDVWWKANLRNVELLRRHASLVEGEVRRATRSDWLIVAGMMLLLVLLLVGSILVFLALVRLIFRELGTLFI